MRALISVSDKTGMVELAQELSKAGIEIISTGGTAKALQQAEIDTVEIGSYTGFPELLEGRLKTLHPKVFGGLLYIRNNPKHASEAEKHDIPSIDWVIVNLYPFERIHMENKIPKSEMIEFVDIGGPSLLRAGSKNFQDVVVLCDHADYGPTIQEFKETGKVSFETRKKLAGKAFAHTAHYDSMIAKFFSRGGPDDRVKTEQPANPFPVEFSVGLKKVSDLRYGENPHQKAALYKESGDREWGVVNAEKLQGKELSFNNYLDLDSSWQIVNALSSGFKGQGLGAPNAACVIIKHTNPCGAAMAPTPLEAFQSACAADPQSAFGGIISFSTTVDEPTAQEITKTFFECVIAPGYTPEALELFKKKPNLRVLRQSTLLNSPYELDFKKISGGMLVQEKDFDPVSVPGSAPEFQETRKVVTQRQPTAEELFSMEFAWRICKFVKSNAIVLSRGTVTQGVGAGQMSRIDSLRIAIEKAGLSGDKVGRLAGIAQKSPGGLALPLVLASDAFFPFRDVVDEAAKVGVSAIIQPSGSIRDQESIDAANEHNIAMIFTGARHFRH